MSRRPADSVGCVAGLSRRVQTVPVLLLVSRRFFGFIFISSPFFFHVLFSLVLYLSNFEIMGWIGGGWGGGAYVLAICYYYLVTMGWFADGVELIQSMVISSSY